MKGPGEGVVFRGTEFTDARANDRAVWPRCAAVSSAKRDASAVLIVASALAIAARWGREVDPTTAAEISWATRDVMNG